MIVDSQPLLAALNSHDLERCAEKLDEAFVWESDTLPNAIEGREAARRMMQIYYRAFPDLHVTIEQLIAMRNLVITRWQVVGTQEGPFLDVAPTNRPVTIHGCTIAEVNDGKAVHLWTYWDTGTLLQQLGLLPGTHHTPQQDVR